MFKGFTTFKYPVITVILPQTGRSVNVRGLTVGETSKIRGSLVTPASSIPIINKCIWNCIEDKPQDYITYDSFLKNTTIRDREVLLFGVFQTTFNKEKDISTRCRQCDKDINFRVILDDLVSLNMYPGIKELQEDYKLSKVINPEETFDPEMEEEIKKSSKSKRKPKKDLVEISDSPIEYVEEPDEEEIQRIIKGEAEEAEQKEKEKSDGIGIIAERKRIVLPVSKVVCYLKQPTLKDEEDSISTYAFSNKDKLNNVSTVLNIVKFEEYNNKGELVGTYDEGIDVVAAYQSLPEQDRKFINSNYVEFFDQYSMKLQGSWNCKNCEFKNEYRIDIMEDFFQEIIVG